jgi:hypothetical protein
MNHEELSPGARQSLRARSPADVARNDEHRIALHGLVRAESRRLHRRALRRRVAARAATVLFVVAAVIFGGSKTALLSGDNGVREITFNFADSSAHRVAVVGEFNDWNPNATLMTRTATGQWRASIGFVPGRYTYSFVVNDSLWIADPGAPRSPERFFGNSKSVLVVASLQ